MATTLTNTYSLSQELYDGITESTVDIKKQILQNKGLNCVIMPAIFAGLLITPLPNIRVIVKSGSSRAVLLSYPGKIPLAILINI